VSVRPRRPWCDLAGDTPVGRHAERAGHAEPALHEDAFHPPSRAPVTAVSSSLSTARGRPSSTGGGQPPSRSPTAPVDGLGAGCQGSRGYSTGSVAHLPAQSHHGGVEAVTVVHTVIHTCVSLPTRSTRSRGGYPVEALGIVVPRPARRTAPHSTRGLRHHSTTRHTALGNPPIRRHHCSGGTAPQHTPGFPSPSPRGDSA